MTAADQFKSYDQLQSRLKMVLGQKSAPARLDEETADEDNDRGSFAPEFKSRRPNLLQISMHQTSLPPNQKMKMRMMLCPTSETC